MLPSLAILTAFATTILTDKQNREDAKHIFAAKNFFVMAEKEKKIEQVEGQMPAVEAGAEAAAPETGAPAPSPAKSKRDSYLEGFRKKHPDWQDDDEEGFYGALADDDAAMNEQMNGYKSREEELSTALSGSPLNAALFLDAVNGEPIPLSILKRYPNEVKEWMDDPENADAVQEVFQNLADLMAKNKEFDAEADKNLEETQSLIDQMIADGELASDDEANSVVELLGKIAVGMTMNHLEKDWIIAARNALNHDSDVDAARTEGEINGRNAKIEAKRNSGSKGAANHTNLGSSNAGQRLTAKENRAASGGGRNMWEGMKVNKLN